MFSHPESALQQEEVDDKSEGTDVEEPFSPSAKDTFDLDLDKHVHSPISHSPPEPISPSREQALKDDLSPVYDPRGQKPLAVGVSPSEFIPEEPEFLSETFSAKHISQDVDDGKTNKQISEKIESHVEFKTEQSTETKQHITQSSSLSTSDYLSFDNMAFAGKDSIDDFGKAVVKTEETTVKQDEYSTESETRHAVEEKVTVTDGLVTENRTEKSEKSDFAEGHSDLQQNVTMESYLCEPDGKAEIRELHSSSMHAEADDFTANLITDIEVTNRSITGEEGMAVLETSAAHHETHVDDSSENITRDDFYRKQISISPESSSEKFVETDMDDLQEQIQAMTSQSIKSMKQDREESFEKDKSETDIFTDESSGTIEIERLDNEGEKNEKQDVTSEDNTPIAEGLPAPLLVSEPHENMKEFHESLVIDTILDRCSHDMVIVPDEPLHPTAFRIGQIEYEAADDEEDKVTFNERNTDFSTASSLSDTYATATVTDTSTEDQLDQAIAEGHKDYNQLTRVPIGYDDIVKKSHFEIPIVSDPESSTAKEDSASLDSEDMDEPYGDQKDELAEEMMVDLTPSPQPPSNVVLDEDDDKKQYVDTSLTKSIGYVVRPEAAEVEALKTSDGASAEAGVKTSSSSDTSAEPTLLAATYDLELGAVSRVVAAYDISPDTVEKTLTVESQPKAILSSPEDEVFERDMLREPIDKQNSFEKIDSSQGSGITQEPCEREPSPFEVLSDSDLVGYVDFLESQKSEEENVQTVISGQPDLFGDDTSSFDHTSPVSSEHSDRVEDIPACQMPSHVIQSQTFLPDNETNLIDESQLHDEESGNESYMHINGPTEVDFSPEHDLDVSSQPTQVISYDSTEQQLTEPADVDNVSEMPQEMGISGTTDEGTGTDVLTQGIMEDLHAPEPDFMMTSDHTLYDMDMPTEEGSLRSSQIEEQNVELGDSSTQQIPADVHLEHATESEADTSWPDRIESDDAQRTLSSEQDVTESEVGLPQLTASTPSDYVYVMSTPSEEPQYISEDTNADDIIRETEENYSDEFETNTEDLQSKMTEFECEIEATETPEPELLALAESEETEEEQSHYFAPVAESAQLEATSNVKDIFELQPDAFDIQRPKSPIPDYSRKLMEDSPVSNQSSPLENDEHTDEPVYHEDNAENINEQASMFVHAVIEEAQASVKEPENEHEDAVVNDNVVDKVQAKLRRKSSTYEEYEVHRETEDYELSDSSSDQDDIFADNIDTMKEIDYENINSAKLSKQESEDIPEITITQHLHEETDEEDYPLSYAKDHSTDESESLAELNEQTETEIPIEITQDQRCVSIESLDDRAHASEDSVSSVEEGLLASSECPALPLNENDSDIQSLGDDECTTTDPFLGEGPDGHAPKETISNDDSVNFNTHPFLVEGVAVATVAATDIDMDNQLNNQQNDMFVSALSEPAQINTNDGSLYISAISDIKDEPEPISITENQSAPDETQSDNSSGEKTPQLGSPDDIQDEVKGEMCLPDNDSTNWHGAASVNISMGAADLVSPEDYGETSSVDSFATVVALQQQEEDRLADIASMESSFTSDMQSSFHDDQQDSLMSIDCRYKEDEDEDEEEPEGSSSGSDKFEIIEREYEGNLIDIAIEESPLDDKYDTIQKEELEAILEVSSDKEAEAEQSDQSKSKSSSERLDVTASDSSDKLGSSPECALESPGIMVSGKFFGKSAERDDISVSSSLLEFENLEKDIQEKGSLDNMTMCIESPRFIYGRGNEKDEGSLSSSLAEFERIESELVGSDSLEKIIAEGKVSSGEASSLSSLTEFERLEQDMQSESDGERDPREGCVTVSPLEKGSRGSSMASLTEFEQLEQQMIIDDELHIEAQKVVSMLESGALVPTPVKPEDHTDVKVKDEQEFSSGEISGEASKTENVQSPELDRDSLTDADDQSHTSIVQIIREASRNVEIFSKEGVEQSEALAIVRHVLEEQRAIALEGESVPYEHSEDVSQIRESDVDSLDGDYTDLSTLVVSPPSDGDVVPAEHTTKEIDADSLQDSESQSRSGALDSDSLHDQDSVMQISAESFEFDQPEGCRDSNFDTMKTSGDSLPPDELMFQMDAFQSDGLMTTPEVAEGQDKMQQSIDSLQLDEGILEISEGKREHVMQQSIDSLGSVDPMQKSLDSLGAEVCMIRSVDSLESDALGQVDQKDNVMTRSADSLEPDGIERSESRDDFDKDSLHEGAMESSTGSIDMPKRNKQVSAVMEISSESGAWSQSSSIFSTETLVSSDNNRDIMQMSIESPDMEKISTLEYLPEENVSPQITHAADYVYKEDIVICESELEPSGPQKESWVDTEGNLHTALDHIAVDKQDKNVERNTRDPNDASNAAVNVLDQKEFSIVEACHSPDSPPINLPSSDPSHSDNCYCPDSTSGMETPPEERPSDNILTAGIQTRGILTPSSDFPPPACSHSTHLITCMTFSVSCVNDIYFHIFCCFCRVKSSHVVHHHCSSKWHSVMWFSIFVSFSVYVHYTPTLHHCY